MLNYRWIYMCVHMRYVTVFGKCNRPRGNFKRKIIYDIFVKEKLYIFINDVYLNEMLSTQNIFFLYNEV